jgi:hypothetical protein
MKRFTETNKWQDPWFRKLPPQAKLLWLWLLDNCDCAGIIEPDKDLAGFMIGATEDLDSSFEAIADRIQWVGEKLVIPKFIRFQYGDKLNAKNSAHIGVIRRIETLGIALPVEIEQQSPFKAPSKPLASPHKSPYQGAQDKDKDKDKDKDLMKASTKKSKEKPSIDEVRTFCKEIELPETDGDATFWKWEGNGWTNGNKPIKDWKATIRSWKSAGHLPSQKLNGRFNGKPSQSSHAARHQGECQEDNQTIPF